MRKERLDLVQRDLTFARAGRTADSWLGPDILEVLPVLAARGRRGVLVCPAGFVSDHLEVLYDLDLEARHAAEQLGLLFARTRMPNADPGFLATLAEIVQAHVHERIG